MFKKACLWLFFFTYFRELNKKMNITYMNKIT